MVIEYARNVLGLQQANSTEMNPETPDNVIDIMEEQKHISNMGGTMRLGAYDCRLKPGSHAAAAYGATDIRERHRHRYEFNSTYRTRFEQAGLSCVGENPSSGLVEVVEIPSLRWFVGTQYHPRILQHGAQPQSTLRRLREGRCRICRRKNTDKQ